MYPQVRKIENSGRGGRDESGIKCYNCNFYGHYVAKCHKPGRDKEQRQEVNIAQIEDDEPALLLTEYEEKKDSMMLLNEKKVVLKLSSGGEEKWVESYLWYLENGASNHMTGQRSKFKELDERVTGQVRLDDGSTVNIKENGFITFKCKNREERTLQEVYYIPTLCNNIISISQLSYRNRVVLTGEFFWVFDK